MANATYQGQINQPVGGQVGTTFQNWLTSSDFIEMTLRAEPDVRKELIRKYGSQDLNILRELRVLGNYMGIDSPYSIWFEEDWRRSNFTVAAYNSGGTQANLTVAVADTYTYPGTANQPYFPYMSITGGGNLDTNTMFPVRLKDTVEINGIECQVTAINTGTRVIQVTCTQDGETIPDIEATDVIIITGNAWEEGSAGSQGRETRTLKNTGFIQIVKDVYKTTGTALGQKSAISVDGKDYWYMEGINNTRKYMDDMLGLTLLTGRNITSNRPEFAITSKTKGVIPAIEDEGITFDYNELTGITVEDFEDFNLELIQNKGANEYMLWTEASVDMQIDRLFRSELNGGAVVYSSDMGEKAVNLGYRQFVIGSTTFNKKKFLPFNDKQSLGAVERYKGMIVAVPMTTATIYKEGTGDSVDAPALCITYQNVIGESMGFREDMYGGAGMAATKPDDIQEVHMRQRIGLNMFGLNRYGLGKPVA